MADEKRSEDLSSEAWNDDWKDCAKPVNGFNGERGGRGFRYGEEMLGAAINRVTSTLPQEVIDRHVDEMVGKTHTQRRGPDYEGVRRAAVDRIRARLAEKREEYAGYLSYSKIRLREEDLHSIWDAAINASEVSCYLDGLVFALEALGEKP